MTRQKDPREPGIVVEELQQHEGSEEIAPFVCAPIYERVLAFFIDVGFVYGVVLSFSLGLGTMDNRRWIMILAFFFSWFYLTVFSVKGNGQTIGHRVFGVRVIMTDGSHIGVLKAMLRSILISAIVAPFGFVAIAGLSFIIFSLLSLNVQPTKQRKQTFWDIGTKTCVILGGKRLRWNRW